MTSEKKIDANRANAQSSTGPKTEGGRERSSRNAFKHGLTAEKIVVGKETKENLNAFYEDLMQELKPVGALETNFAERVALDCWRQRRVYAYEVGMTQQAQRETVALLSGEIPEGAEYADLLSCQKKNGLVHLSRHETALGRRIRENMAELERLQARRVTAARLSTNEAATQLGASDKTTVGVASKEQSRPASDDTAAASAPTARMRLRPPPR